MNFDRLPRSAGNGSEVRGTGRAVSGGEVGARRSAANSVFLFGHFRVLLRARQLYRDGQAVELGGRAFDLLLALIEANGAILAKEALMDHVWPLTCVDESSLRVQMSTLRKALGKDRDLIKTIPGRGYLFTVDVDEIVPDQPVLRGQPQLRRNLRTLRGDEAPRA